MFWHHIWIPWPSIEFSIMFLEAKLLYNSLYPSLTHSLPPSCHFLDVMSFPRLIVNNLKTNKVRYFKFGTLDLYIIKVILTLWSFILKVIKGHFKGHISSMSHNFLDWLSITLKLIKVDTSNLVPLTFILTRPFWLN